MKNAKRASRRLSEATIMVEVDGEMEHAAAMGNGPVNALDQALRRALTKFYPALKDVELLDYKVRVLSSGEGTGAVGAGFDRIRRRQGPLGYRRRFAQRHRGELASAGG